MRRPVEDDLRKHRPMAPPLRVLFARVQYLQPGWLAQASQHSALDVVPDTSAMFLPYQSSAVAVPEGPEHLSKGLGRVSTVAGDTWVAAARSMELAS